MGCLSGTSKCLLSLFNFIFFVAGTIILGIGIWLAIDKSSFIVLLRHIEHESIEHFTSPVLIDQIAYVLIACGAVAFFISFLGYCGALRESSCLLTLYASLMILILLAEIAIGCVMYAMKDQTEAETKKLLSTSLEKYYDKYPSMDIVTLTWDETMVSLNCCGVDGYKDFDRASTWVQNKNMTIPRACCKFKNKLEKELEDPNCPRAPTQYNSNQGQGCYKAVQEWIDENKKWVIITLAIIGVTELVLIILSFYLCSSIDRYRRMRM